MERQADVTHRWSIYREIDEERGKQDDEWGGAEHDDAHSPEQWLTIALKHLGRASHSALMIHDPDALGIEPHRYREVLLRSLRGTLIKVCAVLVAWIESIDRGTGEQPAEIPPATPSDPSGDRESRDPRPVHPTSGAAAEVPPEAEHVEQREPVHART